MLLLGSMHTTLSQRSATSVQLEELVIVVHSGSRADCECMSH